MLRARETLTEAETLLRAERFTGAVNRFYYAAFHATRALLATRGLDSSKHSGVIALFQLTFVKTNLFPRDQARALPRAFEKRLNSDYEDFVEITVDDAEHVAVEVEAFVNSCAEILERELAGPSVPPPD